MHLAVVDDDAAILEQIAERIEQILCENKVIASVDRFRSASALWSAYQAKRYSALFLDIDMPQQDGFALTEALRSRQDAVPVIYITNRDDLITYAFRYRALGFVRKRHLDTELPYAIATLLHELDNTPKVITVTERRAKGGKKQSVFIDDILYIESQNQAAIRQAALQTRLRDDEIKLKETLQWSQSVRVLRHDLSNHLISIARYIQNDEHQKALQYIEKISQKMDAIPHYMNTNSQTVNAMLDLKRMICRQEGIDLKCYVQEQLPDFDDAAFCTVFGNLMDNAIEAERSEPVKSIRLALETASDYLHITVQNRIHQPVLADGILPRTTKADAAHHGLGLQSVMETVEQMSGAIHIREQDGWFIADVLLPVKEGTS